MLPSVLLAFREGLEATLIVASLAVAIGMSRALDLRTGRRLESTVDCLEQLGMAQVRITEKALTEASRAPGQGRYRPLKTSSAAKGSAVCWPPFVSLPLTADHTWPWSSGRCDPLSFAPSPDRRCRLARVPSCNCVRY